MDTKAATTVRLSARQHRRLNLLSASLGVSMSALVVAALNQSYGPVMDRLEAAADHNDDDAATLSQPKGDGAASDRPTRPSQPR